MHTYGSGFTDWGAGVGFDLNATGGKKSVFNASGYKGIVFTAALGTTLDSGVNIVNLTVPEAATVAMASTSGGTCQVDPDAGITACGDYHIAQVTLTSTPTQHFIPFTSLAQKGYGEVTPIPFDPHTIISIEFQVDANQTFDFWIDDVGFYN